MLVLANASTAVGSETEELVLRLLVQLLVILVATRVVTVVVRRLGQTDVSGEILAGLLLGPSALGLVFPEISTELFHPSTSTIFVGLAQIGLILLMFQIGMEFEFSEQLGQRKASVVAVSLAGLVLPFVCGYLSAPWFHEQLAAPRPPLLGFRLFFAVSMSITAIPILGRIFMELGLSHTRTAALVIGSAAIDDVVGWLLLGSVSLIVAEQFSFVWAAQRIGLIGVYVIAVFFVVRPLLKQWLARDIARRGGLGLPTIAVVLIVLLCSASLTSYLGVFAIIGGFLIGLALHDDRRFVALWNQRVSPLVMMLLLPVFFAYTGLRTDIGALDGWWGLAVCGLVIVVAFGSKFGGAFLAARAVGESSRDALTIGVCMNTRALMELIVINIGYDMGVVPRDMFTMLVIMALVSTFVATPLIGWLMKGERRQVAAT
ncbi:cation:proton antiporter [Enhygromyxa salina]|uniref:High-affinity Na(+)/H(+) antiporter NhaS3 n=1 Tax=Enhygromyxa salina TaxID=215803 RepID=A0A2S9YY18_9BACT|nr:cation:proton antiporter [Enhygromyxa salina]PRQ09977.1 High-affinity Na(+)/H(+) antiporter NhaS3 [Enhygromyxa salina]